MLDGRFDVLNEVYCSAVAFLKYPILGQTRTASLQHPGHQHHPPGYQSNFAHPIHFSTDHAKRCEMNPEDNIRMADLEVQIGNYGRA